MIELTVNGQTHAIDADPDTPLLYVLREDLQLNAAKFGCGLGQCGACTVLVDGDPALACVIPIFLLAGRKITTLEGLGTVGDPAPIQQAFMEEQAAQCGYCIAGMMMRAYALLQRSPRATDAQIRAHLEPNLCRCGTHMRILRATRRAAILMQRGNSIRTATDAPARSPGDAQLPRQNAGTGAVTSQSQDPRPAGEREAARHPEERERPER